VDHIKPDCSELDQAEPNPGLHHQIIKWNLRSYGVFLTDVTGQFLGPIFKHQKN